MNHISHWAWVGMKYRPVIRRDTRQLAEKLCNACGYTLAEIASRTRKRKIVNIRQQVIYVIKTRDSRTTHKELGEIFGGLDHTTITHSIIAANNHIQKEPKYKEAIDRLMDY